MILTVLIGNTNSRLTWLSRDRVLRRRVVPTSGLPRALAALPARPGGSTALASVVPGVTSTAVRALTRLTGRPPLVVGPRTPTGLRFRYRRRELGADRICVAVGAFARFRRDVIALDFGTATTVNVVTGEGTFLGGAIVPGMRMMLDGLARNTARLPAVSPGCPSLPFGRSTRAALQAGVCHLLAGGIEHIIAEVERRTRRHYYVVATGGAAGRLRSRLRRIRTVDPDLAARGLARVDDIIGGRHD
ncbi:type III pantothenate kinase [candidate division WOR-3 bacterium]|nr:type III pantothenate kinase [candidate division WOR-3 bacterium]